MQAACECFGAARGAAIVTTLAPPIGSGPIRMNRTAATGSDAPPRKLGRKMNLSPRQLAQLHLQQTQVCHHHHHQLRLHRNQEIPARLRLTA